MWQCCYDAECKHEDGRYIYCVALAESVEALSLHVAWILCCFSSCQIALNIFILLGENSARASDFTVQCIILFCEIRIFWMLWYTCFHVYSYIYCQFVLEAYMKICVDCCEFSIVEQRCCRLLGGVYISPREYQIAGQDFGNKGIQRCYFLLTFVHKVSSWSLLDLVCVCVCVRNWYCNFLEHYLYRKQIWQNECHFSICLHYTLVLKTQKARTYLVGNNLKQWVSGIFSKHVLKGR